MSDPRSIVEGILWQERAPDRRAEGRPEDEDPDELETEESGDDETGTRPGRAEQRSGEE